MAQRKVALITGANRGIGLEIARRLCQETADIFVILTGRNVVDVKAACNSLQADGLPALYMELDVNDKSHIHSVAKEVQLNFGGLDILINNAGVMYKPSYIKETRMPYAQQAELTMTTNFFSIVDICEAMFPLLRSSARVVHMSSILAKPSCLSKDLRSKLSDQKTTPDLLRLMRSYVAHAKEGTYKERGWPEQSETDWVPAAYAVSKLGVNALARVQARELSSDETRTDLVVSSCCPGWVKTSMGGPTAPLAPFEGADTPLFCATLPPGSDSGLFYKDRKAMRKSVGRSK